MVDNLYSDFSVETAVKIVQTCLAAQRPEMIVPALLDRRSPEGVAAELAASRTTRPAVASVAPTSGSIFGEPTPAQRDALAAAIKKRFEAMAGKASA